MLEIIPDIKDKMMLRDPAKPLATIHAACR